MGMRNQWVEVNVSSSQNNVATGPRSKDDTMNITLYQNNEGSSQEILDVRCYSETRGKDKICITKAYNKITGECIFSHESPRQVLLECINSALTGAPNI